MSMTTTTTLSSTNSELCQDLSNSFSTTNTTENLSINRNTLAIHMPDINTLVNTPSPSSIASGSSRLDHSSSRSSKNLCSTLKGDHSLKRRARYDRLFHQSQNISKQYMLTMTNLFFQMQREIFRLRRRTRHVERLLSKQKETSRPLIRIARLTEDQISTICVEDEESAEDETTGMISEQSLPSTHTNNSNRSQQILKNQRKPKRLINTSKKTSPKVWINNRQKPIDYQKYCHRCKREYSKRSNYLLHIRKVHNNFQKNVDINTDDLSNEIIFPDETTEHSNVGASGSNNIINQISTTIPSPIKIPNQMRTRSRLAGRIDLRSPPERRTKCHHCGKTFDAKYIETHKRLAHAEVVDDHDSTVDNRHRFDQQDIINLPSVGTPATTIDIAESEIYDEPIRFSDDSQKPIYLAVTCLEAYQVDLVNQFLHRFSTRVCQSVNVDSRTTHLVANDDEHPLRSPLSMKLIEAIAHHCFCVSIRWISECLKNDQIIDETSFEIQGDNTETEAHHGPSRSRLNPTRYSLFKNICFMIKCTENPDVKMTNSRLEQLITTCGGQIITCVTQRLLEQYTIIVLCDNQYVTERRHNYEQCRKLGINFVSSDWVLESVLEYRQKPFVLFEEIPS